MQDTWHLEGHRVDLLFWERPGTIEHLEGERWAVRGKERTFVCELDAGRCSCRKPECRHLQYLKERLPRLPRRCGACKGIGVRWLDREALAEATGETTPPACAACKGKGVVR